MKYRLVFCVLACLILTSCGGGQAVKTRPAPSNKPAAQTKPAVPPNPTVPPTTQPKQSEPASPSASNNKPAEPTKPGGYYMDDGPEANPPTNLESIPNATPKVEPLLPRSNKPYKALGNVYTPLTTAQDYKVRGVASWYGKRFHGKKTSSGELYDMYGMTAAHTILPLPSYAKVTNIANGKSVIVRVNDRGPFKKERLIDLSYAAAYKLDLIKKGSGMVEVEALHPNRQAVVADTTPSAPQAAPNSPAASTEPAVAAAPASSPSTTATPTEPAQTPPTSTTPEVVAVNTPVKPSPATKPTGSNNPVAAQEYFLQAGAFKSELNAETFLKRIQALDVAQNAGLTRVYNNDFHRVRLGPFETKAEAEQVATQLRKRFSVSVIILNQ